MSPSPLAPAHADTDAPLPSGIAYEETTEPHEGCPQCRPITPHRSTPTLEPSRDGRGSVAGLMEIAAMYVEHGEQFSAAERAVVAARLRAQRAARSEPTP